MSCTFIDKNIDPYFDKELLDSELNEIEQHLKSCPDCNKKYLSYKKSIRVMRNLFDDKLPPVSLKKSILSKTGEDK